MLYNKKSPTNNTFLLVSVLLLLVFSNVLTYKLSVINVSNDKVIAEKIEKIEKAGFASDKLAMLTNKRATAEAIVAGEAVAQITTCGELELPFCEQLNKNLDKMKPILDAQCKQGEKEKNAALYPSCAFSSTVDVTREYVSDNKKKGIMPKKPSSEIVN